MLLEDHLENYTMSYIPTSQIMTFSTSSAFLSYVPRKRFNFQFKLLFNFVNLRNEYLKNS